MQISFEFIQFINWWSDKHKVNGLVDFNWDLNGSLSGCWSSSTGSVGGGGKEAIFLALSFSVSKAVCLFNWKKKNNFQIKQYNLCIIIENCMFSSKKFVVLPCCASSVSLPLLTWLWCGTSVRTLGTSVPAAVFPEPVCSDYPLFCLTPAA